METNPKGFPIAKELLTLARLGWSRYQDYMESKAKEQAAERSIHD